MDITPRLESDALLIRNYGPAGFTVAETLHAGSILVTMDAVHPLAEGVSIETLDATALIQTLKDARTELVLLGGGKEMQNVPDALKASLRAAGIASEAMDTGAACRTYNVLMAEGRHVAAVLLSVA
jgi:uncharacterized protein